MFHNDSILFLFDRFGACLNNIDQGCEHLWLLANLQDLAHEPKQLTVFASKGTLDIAIISTPMGCKGGWIQGARRVAKGGKNLWKKMPVLCQEYMLFFCLPLSNQPRLNTQQQGRAGGEGRHTA